MSNYKYRIRLRGGPFDGHLIGMNTHQGRFRFFQRQGGPMYTYVETDFREPDGRVVYRYKP